MRYQGKITRWNDDKGYGFVVQNGGSEQVFIHIKSFSNRQRRPVGDEIVTYEIATDAQGRKRAENVEFISRRAASTGSGGTLTLILSPVFLAFVAIVTFFGKLPVAVLGLYLVASLLAYFAYAKDKTAARNGEWRTQEDSLHLLSLMGGWPGALIAQKRLRHKSRKASFQVVFWTTVVVNCGVLGWMLTPSGSAALRSMFAGT